jgi:hypothetical protein
VGTGRLVLLDVCSGGARGPAPVGGVGPLTAPTRAEPRRKPDVGPRWCFPDVAAGDFWRGSRQPCQRPRPHLSVGHGVVPAVGKAARRSSPSPGYPVSIAISHDEASRRPTSRRWAPHATTPPRCEVRSTQASCVSSAIACEIHARHPPVVHRFRAVVREQRERNMPVDQRSCTPKKKL